MLPIGATLLIDYIHEDLETALLNNLDKEIWYGALGRRVIHYGSQYKYFPNESTRQINEIPIWIQNLVPFSFNQVIVNEYLPGQGIAPHIDHTRQFGPAIATLSLNSDCVMDFANSIERKSILLPRRSLLVLKDDARYKWTHGIAKRLKDPIPDSEDVLVRSKRISITFRTDLFNKIEIKNSS